MEFNPMMSNNSISNYNKLFNREMQNFNISSDKNGMTGFDSILNQQMTMDKTPIVNGGIQMNVGLENMGISPVGKMDGVSEVHKVNGTSAVQKTASDFGKAFGSGLNSVSDAQNTAYSAAETFAAGGDISVHEVMLASQKANLSMQMAIQLRNKMLTAYNEINNVRV